MDLKQLLNEEGNRIIFSLCILSILMLLLSLFVFVSSDFKTTDEMAKFVVFDSPLPFVMFFILFSSYFIENKPMEKNGKAVKAER